jgi:RNA polymerase sigma-70 factor (ECF subfamily)
MRSETLAIDEAARSERRSGTVIRPACFQRDDADLGDDAELVRGVVAGELAAQEGLFDKYAPEVERWLYRLLGHDPDIADALQDVFLQVFRHLARLREPRTLRAWLRAVTVATARKRIRSKARRRWLRFMSSDELPEVQVHAADDEALAALRATYAVLDTMNVELRIVFVLRYLEQLKLEAIAEACQASLATVKRRLQKADEIFVTRALRDPNLIDWVREGSRWGAR